MKTVGNVDALIIRSSKGDQQGVGETMPLEHTCGVAPPPSCPACSLKKQVLARIAEGAVDGDPLFVDEKGNPLNQRTLTSLAEGTAAAMGEKLIERRNKRTWRRFGSHLFRVSGACHLALLGATEQDICRAGRWSSLEIMRKYLRGVPRALNAGLPLTLLAKGSSSAVASLDRSSTAKFALDLVTPSALLAKEVDRCLTEMEEDEPKDVLVAVGDGFLFHVKPEGELRSLTTACGLKIAKELSVEQTRDIDLELLCPACCSFRSIDSWLAAAMEL